MAQVVVVTSGKGGVGKTTSTAALGAALAREGSRVAVIDFDVGLRNLDLVMGAERRVVFDLIHVVQGSARLSQALIRDKRVDTLFLLAASQTRDKDALTDDGIERVIRELRLTFDWIICDSSVQEIENEAAVMTPKREIAICLVVASTLLSGGALAEGAGQDATTITANYGVYWAGLHFGEVRLVMTVRGSRYEMKGSGRFSVLGGLIYEWRGSTTSAGELTKTGPKPSLYTLNYSGADKHGDVRISFADGAVSDVSMSPKKRANPKNIPVTKDQLRGVLDPMTGAFLRARPDLTNADLKVCDETIPAFDGKLRFDIVLVPKQQRQVESKEPEGYSGPAAVCGVKFVPISGFRPGDRGINFMSSHADEIEVWLVPLYSTVMYLPYRISVPTAFGSGSAEMLSFQVTR